MIRRIISVVPLQSPVVFNPFNLRVNGDMSLCKVALDSESVDAIQLLAFQRNLFVVNFMSWYTLFLSLFGILGGF